MPVRDILKLGNPKLYEVSAPVERAELPEVETVVRDLHDTMLKFRAEWNAGRAIAAPQIGFMKRLIHMNVGEPVAFVNPVLTPLDDEMMEVWDDCMCFPELLVKVMRHRRIRIDFRDLAWNEQSMTLDGDLSELLQHEADHLDGILAVSRAIDGQSFALRSRRGLLS